MEDLSIGIPSAIDNSIGRMLAIQARRESSVGSSSEPQRDLYIPHPPLIKKLRKFLKDPSAQFKTPEQAEAIEFVLLYERHLLLVGPTAMGKTLAYMIPAAERSHGITCVLLPPSALHADFDRRCEALGIESSRWTPQNANPVTKIVYVSPEHAQMKQFTDYLFKSCTLGLLKHFVVDEAHLVASHSDFRFSFLALKPLINCGKFKTNFIEQNLNQSVQA